MLSDAGAAQVPRLLQRERERRRERERERENYVYIERHLASALSLQLLL
jgi:hypothetical protein